MAISNYTQLRVGDHTIRTRDFACKLFSQLSYVACTTSIFSNMNICANIGANIGAMIVEDLSREENKFLEFVPPHAHDYDEILIKNFGNRASPEVYQFHIDLIEFHDSVMRIARLREEV
ncbi:hypothetical protein PV326_007735 [Microctonus aethiopoides]|nr:hypothetical protein PV326_007735 [Microctonus aethiopoides]